MAIRGIRQTRRALDAELPGSRPGWPAMPPRTACGSAFVRRTARFDPGRRLSCPRSPMAGGTPLRWAAVPVRVRPRIRPRVRRPGFPCTECLAGVGTWRGLTVAGCSAGRGRRALLGPGQATSSRAEGRPANIRPRERRRLRTALSETPQGSACCEQRCLLDHRHQTHVSRPADLLVIATCRAKAK